jgi:formylglycine-generating enzyme required for sulfatase activity
MLDCAPLTAKLHTWFVVLVLSTVASLAAAADASPSKQAFTNGIGMVMIRMPGGYCVGKFEVTQEQYQAVMGRNPSKYKSGRNPVERVSWHDAMAFCRALTGIEKDAGRLPAGFAYSLPSEKQWNEFVGDASLEDAVHGRFGKDGEPLGPVEVGSRRANQFGLHDVRGNVWEWCLDDYLPNYNWKVLRGGAWSVSDPDNLAVSVRLNVEPETAYDFYGFRCVLTRE